jgi:hypothetical protein
MKHTNDPIQVARKAFAAYEAVLKAIQQCPPPKVPGPTVMTQLGDSWSYRFKCSECAEEWQHCQSWKFCPHRGCEIIRFDLIEKPEPTHWVMVTETEEPRRVSFDVKVKNVQQSPVSIPLPEPFK